MRRDKRQEALTYLLKQAEEQGYVTFDNIMDCADANSLPIQDFDWLTSAITTRGTLIYDEAPSNRITSEQYDDDYDDYAQSDYDAVYNRIIEIDDSLKNFVEEVRNIVPPQRRELSTLKYQVVEGNQHARNRMIMMHLRIALKIALQRTETYDMDIVDAVGDACIGLINAVDKYNPDNNGAFGSYAAMWILQNISRHQPTRRPLMYYPVHRKDLYFSAYPILKEAGYTGIFDSENAEEGNRLLRKRLGFTDDQIEEVLSAATPFESIDEVLHEKPEEYNQCNSREKGLDNILEAFTFEKNVELDVMSVMLKEQLKKVMNGLQEREKTVLELRYGLIDGEEKSLEEVGRKFGLTRERIRQIENNALKKLRSSGTAKMLQDFLD